MRAEPDRNYACLACAPRYGAFTIAGGDGSRQPNAREFDITRHQGEYVAKFVAKLTR